MGFVDACVHHLITLLSPKVTPFLPVTCTFNEQTRRNSSQDYTHTLIMRVSGIQNNRKKTLGFIQDAWITDDQDPVIFEAISQIMTDIAQYKIFQNNYSLEKDNTAPYIFTITWSATRLAALTEEQRERKKDGHQHRSTAA